MIEVICEECGEHYWVPVVLGYLFGICPKCGHKQDVPIAWVSASDCPAKPEGKE